MKDAGRPFPAAGGPDRQEVQEKLNHRYIRSMRSKWALFVLAMFVLAAQTVVAQTANQPAYVPNQLLIRVAPGTTQAELNSAIEELGARMVKPVALANTYLVELIQTRGATVETAVTRAGSISKVTDASPNYYAYKTATPLDPSWSYMWGMRMIKAPEAWNIQKGQSSVIVAIVDDGISPTHPDLQGRLLPGTDVANDDGDPAYQPTDPESGHGVHVAGTVAAQGDNNEGLVGVCWNGVKILPVKVFSDYTSGAAEADIIDGLEYAKQQGASVVNMSLGGSSGSEMWHAKIKELYDAGIIIVAAAGNSSGPVLYPAAWEECIAVSALNPDEKLTNYSCFGPEIDIAAPGGEDYEDGPDSVWSTAWDMLRGDHYAGYQGTSMAASHVAGAAALLISNGVPPNQVAERLYRGARAPKSGTLDPRQYGNGVLDLYAALRTSAVIDVVLPTDGQVLDTATPIFKISTYLVDETSIKMYMDFTDANRDGLPDDLTQNIVFDGSLIGSDPDRIEYDATTRTLTIKWPVAGQLPLDAGTHTLCVTGEPTEGADQTPVNDTMIFFIQPHVVTAGRHLFSVPYPLDSSITPYDLFGSISFRLARYVPSLGGYAKVNYPGEIDSPEAWPASPGVHPHGATQDTPPAGLGFVLELLSDTPIVVDGIADKTRAYDITLTRGASGWNLIGNPFPFPVPWESVKIVYQGKTLTLNEAIAAGWIRPALYRYTTSGYTFDTPPSAVLVPWEAHWVRILPNEPDRVNDTMVLIVPPIESGAIVETPRSRAAASSDGWSFRLAASAGGVTDSHNFIGVDSRADDGFDTLDVEKPPVLDRSVELSFVHRDWGDSSGRYASDYRTGVGAGETWEFEVTTDMASKDVTITWPDISSVPKKHSLILEDVDGGSKTYMRTRSAYTYNSGTNAGPRHFRLRAEPADAGRILLTNVVVSKTKGATVNISYTVSRDARVEVRLRDSGNRLVTTLGGNTTRAAGLNSTHWDSTINGRQAPSGLYMVEIIATSLDGEVAKTVRPVLVR